MMRIPPIKERLQRLLILTFWIISTVILPGQLISQNPTYIFDQINVEDGLPHHIPILINQDQEGYLWMTSDAGLIKYDGFEFELFQWEKDNINSLSENNLHSLFIDSRDNIWIGSLQKGLNIYASDRNHIIRFDGRKGYPKLRSSNIYFTIEDWQGHIWIGGEKGIEILKPENESYTLLEDGLPFSELLDEIVTTAVLDNNSNIWLGGNGNVWKISSTSIKKYSTPIATEMINDIEIDREEQLWFSFDGNKERVFKYNQSTDTLTSISFIQTFTHSRDIKLEFDHDNNLWYSEFGFGFQMYDINKESIVINSLTNTNLDPEPYAKDPFCDRSGNVWVGQFGLLKYPYPQGFNTFYHYQPYPQVNHAVYVDGDYLWLSIRSVGLLRHHLPSGEEKLFFPNSSDPSALFSDHITGIARLNREELILAELGAIQILNTSSMTFKTYTQSGVNKSVFIDKQDHIWISGNYGLYAFDSQNGIFDTIKLEQPVKGFSRRTTVACQDKEERIWFANKRGGLGIYDKRSKTTLRAPLVHETQGTIADFEDTIEDMVYDSINALIWVASYDGLMKIDPSRMTYIKVNPDEIDLRFYSILISRDQEIWSGTNEGLVEYEILNDHWNHYKSNEGLINTNFYTQSKAILSDGSLIFGGKNGVDYFNPKTLRKNEYEAKPICTELMINGLKRTPPKRHELLDGFVLQPGESFIEMTFSSDHFSSPSENKFSYRISGIHNDWVELGSHPKITIGNLKGSNHLNLKVTNPNGIGDHTLYHIPINFKQHLWNTTWFRIILLVGLSAIVIYYIRKNERNKTKAAEEKSTIKDQINKLEKKALAAQMNPHFIFNSMNAIQEFIYNGENEIAINYLAKFSKIIRAVLNFSSQDRIPLAEEIDFINHYVELQQMRFSSNFKLRVNLPNEIDLYTIEIPPFLLQPHIENAIEHGLKTISATGIIELTFQDIGDYLQVTIDDNGIGRSASKAIKLGKVQPESKGISIIEERINHMKKDHEKVSMIILDKKKNGKSEGTRIELTIPYD
ncbi:MAG: histidine kinase [Saprospiraceae bacterium]|nr:histidine kinase [Saprospiraceae bacterium]